MPGGVGGDWDELPVGLTSLLEQVELRIALISSFEDLSAKLNNMAECGLQEEGEDFLLDVEDSDDEPIDDFLLDDEDSDDFPANFKEYMERELKYSRLEISDKPPGYKSHHSVDFIPDVCAGRKVRLDVRLALRKLILHPELSCSLVQFWARTKTREGRTLLTTQFQPFAIGRLAYKSTRNGLCEYRMGMCREYNNYFYADAECEEEQLGLPGRVFLNKLPESTPDVGLYTLKEYPQRDLALCCKIEGSWAVPVFEHSSHTCVGVLEFVSRYNMCNDWFDKQFRGSMYDIFQEFGLLSFDGYKHYKMQNGDKNKALTAAFQELEMVCESVCKIHNLPLALAWASCPSCDDLLQSQYQLSAPEYVNEIDSEDADFYSDLRSFVDASKFCHLRKGQVTEKILQFPNLLYCSDVKQFSIGESPLVTYSRLCELTGWFKVCLQSSYTGDELYVLEFYLDKSYENDENILTKLRLILGTMEEYSETLKLASGQELGEVLSVEVINFQNYQRSHSIQMIPATRSIPSLELLEDGGVILQKGQLDQPTMDPSSNRQNVVTAERNILVASSSNEGKRKMQDREHKKAGVKIEVSLEEILKCSNMKRNSAARKLNGFGSPTSNKVGERQFGTLNERVQTLQRAFGDHSVDWFIPSVCASHKVRLSIRRALHKLIFYPELQECLVQFWAPTKTKEGRTLLTTQYQPFALGKAATTETNQLCKYRMGMCREYNDFFYADAESGEEQLGLPGRVFLNKLPESNPEVKCYTRKEYPQRDLALRCEIKGSWALPVFEQSSHTCIGVLEIACLYTPTRLCCDKEFHGRMYDIFQEFGLRCFDGHKHYKMQYSDDNKALRAAFEELNMVFEYVCDVLNLPLGLTWVSCRSFNDLLQSQFQFTFGSHCKDDCDDPLNLDYFAEVSKVCLLKKGQVTRRILPFPNLLYCSDIKQFSIAESPLVPHARWCELGGWFTICLQSSYTGDELYVLEFFLPKRVKNDEKILTRLSTILRLLQNHFKTFKLASGQGLGEALSVEVIDFQYGQRSHSIQMIPPASRFIPSLELEQDGGVMLQQVQQDQPSMDAINNGMYVVSETQNYNFPCLDSFKNGKVTTQLDSSDQPSMDPSSNGQNVVTVERNILVVPSSKERKRKMQDRKHKKAGVRIEVSLEEILKCSNMKREDAARRSLRYSKSSIHQQILLERNHLAYYGDKNQ
ncbi:hypothetical protein RHSIM_Rhsim02G0245400 [Rhododendron simsii]|uniref:NLP1-9 GAF domain-containing protein n=1 Tax=Rhododendron simsii TaxID=118357 RepID=A0A834LVQ5_RHOSS|nr:hypothetical protein RHSIM_Rhsim02G0245400 [Rhododendron simsii]